MGNAVLRFLSAKVRRFVAACGGNVAMMYALALLPLTLAAGGGLDYARAVEVKTSMNEALDAAALAVAQSKDLTPDQMQTLAQQYFNANYHQSSDYGTPVAVTVTKVGQVITVSTTCNMPTTMLRMAGLANWTVTSTSSVTFGQTKLWVALVLDNTGSMSDSDRSGNTKIASLKTASHSLLAMLQGAAGQDGDVKVAIIPFAKDVNAGIGSVNANWIDWTDWEAANGSCNISGKTTTGACKVAGTWTDAYCSSSKYTTQKSCTDAKKTWTAASCNIPGYSSQSSCKGAIGTWTPAKHATWNGCVTDRGNPSPIGPDTQYNYDVTNLSPVPGRTTSLFPAEQYSSCTQTVTTLTKEWNTLSTAIDAMSANGSTNQTIGLVWGWHALTDGAPLSPGALPDQTQRVIIILSDGLNTQNRWSGNGSQQSSDVDARMALVCTNAKADGVIIYAVYVDINGAQGNSSVLQKCASPGDGKYYDLTSSGQIQQAFNDIGLQITNLRVTR